MKVFLGVAHWAQDDDAHRRVVHGLCDPTAQTANVPIYAIPRDFADESSNVPEALDTIEIHGTNGQVR